VARCLKLFQLEDPILGKVVVAAAGVRVVSPLRPDDVLKVVKGKGGIICQIFDYLAVASWRHLLHASILALKALREGRMLARDLGIEILLYVAGERQIREAISKVGIKEDSRGIVILYFARDREEAERLFDEVVKELGGLLDDSLIEISEDKMEELKRRFSICEEELKASVAEGEDELKALIKCVLSRVAEIDIKKEA